MLLVCTTAGFLSEYLESTLNKPTAQSVSTVNNSVSPSPISVAPSVASQKNPAKPTTPKSSKVKKKSPSRVVQAVIPAGNGYDAGNCTWYAKSKRPDLPNNLGNADTWASSAAAQGFETGSSPKVGAVGQQGMHVVYVEKVHPNGTVSISEMNYTGFGVVSNRTVAASNFIYIY